MEMQNDVYDDDQPLSVITRVYISWIETNAKTLGSSPIGRSFKLNYVYSIGSI